MDEWRSADERNNREKISRARQAAEDLFKPAQHNADVNAPQSASDEKTPTEQQPRRRPRIFTVPPQIRSGPLAEPTIAPAPTRRKAAAKRPGATVPPSQIGRVRTLATYGMTPAQVAELYGVTVDEIDRILKVPVYSAKAR